MSPLMRQHAIAKRFEFDDAQDAAPGMRQAGAWIDKLVTVDVEAGARLATQHPLAQPLGEKAGGSGVFVVLRIVRDPHFTRDEAGDVVRVLLVVARSGERGVGEEGRSR